MKKKYIKKVGILKRIKWKVKYDNKNYRQAKIKNNLMRENNIKYMQILSANIKNEEIEVYKYNKPLRTKNNNYILFPILGYKTNLK